MKTYNGRCLCCGAVADRVIREAAEQFCQEPVCTHAHSIKQTLFGEILE